MSIARSRAIAAQVSADLELRPALTALDVEHVLNEGLPPLRQYDEDLRASIESRILQEVDR